MLAAREDDGGVPLEVRGAILGVALGMVVTSKRPVRFALALGAILLAAQAGAVPGEKVLDRDRSFFGIYRVVESEDGRLHELYDGTTLHGSQRIEPGLPEPLTYYSRVGPAGQAIAGLPREATRRIGAVGLGAGALACNAGAGQRVDILRDRPDRRAHRPRPGLFTYLRDCGRPPSGTRRRPALARAPRGPRFAMIALDAFSSDAIPVHLVTREAIALYLERLRAARAVLLHLSNRYVDLEPVLGNVARDIGLACRIERHKVTDAQGERGYADSTWALLAREPGRPGPDRGRPPLEDVRGRPSARTWTDDYSNLLGIVDWT